MANPLFGAWDAVYSPAMQELKQGQGIIDIVNTYIAIGLRCGLVGLALFSGFFAVISIRLWKCVKYGGQDKGPNDIGRALLAALVCTLVTIATVSSITFVPVIYYLLAGLSVSYIRCCRSSTKKTKPNQAFTPQNGRHRDIATQFR